MLVHTALMLMAAQCIFSPMDRVFAVTGVILEGQQMEDKAEHWVLTAEAGPMQAIGTGFSCWRLQALQLLPFG